MARLQYLSGNVDDAEAALAPLATYGDASVRGLALAALSEIYVGRGRSAEARRSVMQVTERNGTSASPRVRADRASCE